MFKPHVSARRQVNWELSLDVLEADEALLIFAALPGVDREKVVAMILDGMLVLASERLLT